MEMSQSPRHSYGERMIEATQPLIRNGDLGGLLTRRQRLSCALAWGDRQTHAQIGALHGISHWASKKRVQRARRRLRQAGIDPPNGRGVARRAPAFQLGGIENV
jgi:hypothetical protein